MLIVSSNHTPRDPHYRSNVTIIAQGTSMGVLGVIIVLSNLASIVTFIRTQSLRRRSSYMIINLSVADLLVGFVALTSIHIFLTGKQFNTYIITLEFLDSVTGMTSILIMSTIAVERLYAIYYPFSHRMLRYKSYIGLCVFPWLISITLCSLYLVGYLNSPPLLNVAQVYFRSYPIILALALLIIIISYIAIWIKTRQANPSDQNQNRTSRDRKLAVTLFIVTLASLVTWLPFQCFENLLLICKECHLLDLNILFIMRFLQFANSGLNFFIYMLRMREFRLAFWLMLKCSKKPNRSHLFASTLRNTIGTVTLSDSRSYSKPVGKMNLGFSHRKSYSLSKSVEDGIHRSANKKTEVLVLKSFSAANWGNNL